MIAPLKIPTYFTAADYLSGPVKTMGNNVHSFGVKIESAIAGNERLFRSLTPALSAASQQLLSMAGTAAIITAGFELGNFTVDSITNFETAMDSLQAVTLVSDEAIVGFRAEIKGLATDTKKSSIDIAKSFETIGSNMSEYLDDPKSLRLIAAAGITLSKASRTELEPALDDLTTVMNQFQLKAESAAKTVNILTAGEVVGSVRTAQVAEYLKEFGATAASMNVDLAESTALIEALGKQMDHTKIGVGARNILTAISAAGGLDKKARRDLISSGVDMKFLMNNTHSLSERLHELSKIAHDPIKMVSVFGKENLTAGQVIFNQLAIYDEWEQRIRTTNEASRQAAINSRTLQNAVKELKNSWVNMVTSSDKMNVGLNIAKDTIGFITEHLETLITLGIETVAFFVTWKALLVGANLAMAAYNITVGISNALKLESIAAIEGNIVATRASIITEKLMAAAMWLTNGATATATASTWSLNAAWAANPVGIVILGVAALAAGIGYLIYKQGELDEEYERSLSIKIADSVNQHRVQVDELAKSYVKLGDSMHDATIKSLEFERNAINQELYKVTSQIKEKDNQLWKMETGQLESDGGQTMDEKLALMDKKTQLMAQRLDNTKLIQTNSKAGTITLSEAAKAMTYGDTVEKGTSFGNIPSKDFAMNAETKWRNDPNVNGDMNKRFISEAKNIDFEKIFNNLRGGPKMDYNPILVKIQNDSGSMVDVVTGTTRTNSVLPSTTSTQKLEPKK